MNESGYECKSFIDFYYLHRCTIATLSNSILHVSLLKYTFLWETFLSIECMYRAARDWKRQAITKRVGVRQVGMRRNKVGIVKQTRRPFAAGPCLLQVRMFHVYLN